MNQEQFKRMILQQTEARKQYEADKKNNHLIRTICNRRYKSKGNHDIKEIQKALEEMGFLDDVELVERNNGEMVYQVISFKS